MSRDYYLVTYKKNGRRRQTSFRAQNRGRARIIFEEAKEFDEIIDIKIDPNID
jgi:hypothetical protein